MAFIAFHFRDVIRMGIVLDVRMAIVAFLAPMNGGRKFLTINGNAVAGGVLHVLSLWHARQSACRSQIAGRGQDRAPGLKVSALDDRSEADLKFMFPSRSANQDRDAIRQSEMEGIHIVRPRPSGRLLPPQASEQLHPSPMAPLRGIPPLRLKKPITQGIHL